MADIDSQLPHLPEDRESLRKLVQVLLLERDQHKQEGQEQRRHTEEQKRLAEEQRRLADEQRRQTAQLQAELARLQLELERYKKWYYGPRADRLRSSSELAQLLLNVAEALEGRPIAADDLGKEVEPEEERWRVKRRKVRRNLARFENLPAPRYEGD